MALTIENGTGITGADSFITLVEFTAVLADLFGETSAATDALKEAAIRRAWYYMKSLQWDASDSDNVYPTFGGTIPADVKTAQGILARAELATPNSLAPTVTPGQQKVLTRVGEIGWTATGQTGVDAQRAVVSMAADLLKPYINDTGATGFLLRG